MSWKDDLQTGSFRGVGFFTESSDGELGRRIALHEYPLRDKPYAEDLGKKAQTFTMEIFVLGESYMAERDKLIQALNASGSGTLIHPYRGTIKAVVLSARGPRESTRQGGMASFSVTFVESGENSFPSAKPDTSENVYRQAVKVQAQVKKDFEAGYNIVEKPDTVEKTFTNNLKDTASSLLRFGLRFPGLPQEVSEFARDVEDFVQSIEDLIRAPGDLAVEMAGLIVSMKNTLEKPIDALGMYEQIFDTLFKDGDLDHSSRLSVSAVIENNNLALSRLTATSALVEAVLVSSEVEYDSYDQAQATMARLCDCLDQAMLWASDNVFSALQSLRAALVTDINERAADLSRIIHFTPMATLPALVIAHNLYSDATQAEDIVTRNNVSHPGFVPGGTALEILSRE